jgi:hypothetical protein
MSTFFVCTAVHAATREGDVVKARHAACALSRLHALASCAALALTRCRLPPACSPSRATQLRQLLRANDWAANAELPNLPARHPLLAAVIAGHEPTVALLLKQCVCARASGGAGVLCGARVVARGRVLARGAADASRARLVFRASLSRFRAVARG